MKICKKCGIEKPLEEFYFRKDTKYYRIVCKECIRKYNRDKYKKNIASKNIAKIEKEQLLVKGLRKCNTCNKIKKISEFEKRISRKNGKFYYKRRCSDCEKEKRKEYEKEHRMERNAKHREYCVKNRERMREYLTKYQKEYREKHKDELKEKAKIYRDNHKNEIAKRNKDWRGKHRNELRAKKKIYIKARMENDPIYRLKRIMKSNLYQAFVSKGYRKNKRTKEILGCELDCFYKYLLKTYKDNYGYEWDGIEPVHIDHKYPVSKAQTEKELITLCHYTNLQLLKAEDNIKKSNKLDYVISKN